MDFRISSAFLGSFQNSGWWVIFSSSRMAVCFPSMSKEPPQGVKPFTQILNLFFYYHDACVDGFGKGPAFPSID
jgi:hypothetical protein